MLNLPYLYVLLSIMLIGLLVWAWLNQRKPKVRKNARLYHMGGMWGDAINWHNFDTLQVVGWKPRIPYRGDVLLVPADNGKRMYAIFTKIEPVSGVSDMFFGSIALTRICEGDPEAGQIVAKLDTPSSMHNDRRLLR